MKRTKQIRKERPEREKWVVIDWHGRLKYQPHVNETVQGFEEDVAKNLAKPVALNQSFTAIPISEYERTKNDGIEPT
jgi:hypothetical protein